MKLLKSLAGAALVSLLASPAPAQQAAPGIEPYPLAEKGADLARIWCNACHVTGAEQPERGMDSAPPFATLAPLVRADMAHYRTFLTKPHGPMTEIDLSRDEIEAVLAYILSLGPERP